MSEIENEYSGYIVVFEPRRSKMIWNLLEKNKGFQDSFSLDDWDLSRKEVFFLSLQKRSKEIDAAVLVQRAHGAGGTAKPKYSFDNPVKISPPIKAEELSGVISDFRSNLSSPTRGIRLDSFLWKRFVEKVIELRPKIKDDILLLLSLIDKKAGLLGGSNRVDRLAEQRDSLGVALDIAQIARPNILNEINAEKADTAGSVLDLFDNLPVHERHLVEHDKVILEAIFKNGYKGAKFSGNGVNSVRIYVADKTSIETSLGTDLIIYQSLWNSIILVQYKVMTKQSGVESGWKYYPDKQFDFQISTIDSVMSSYPTTLPTDPWSIRLSDNPFYFKFCEKRKPYSRDDGLIRGISIEVSALKYFLGMKESQSRSGGNVIGYINLPHYLNNTEFSDFAKGGWIGSSGEGTSYLKREIEKALTKDREPIVAIVDIPRLSTAELRKTSRAASSLKERSPKKAK